ncbi:hypothetical protein ACQ86N_06910 [Puia sp. P3]|uniref:hypothetical protein n=1 Tax=Puia sp. P3 TaxID=3423952 RepID=UPI003D66A7E4
MNTKRMLAPFARLFLLITGSVCLFFSNFSRTFASDDFEVIKRVGLDGDIRTPGFFRPLSDITLLINYKLGGVDPWGYYLFNILLHGVNSYLLFLFCLRWKWTDDMRQQRAYALLAAVLFLVYPFHSEGINWVLGRGALLAAFFGLASLVVLCGHGDPVGKRAWVGCFYFFGMAGYETAIVLPVLCIVVLYVQRTERRELFRWGIAFGIVLAAHIAARVVFSGGLAGEYGGLFFKRGAGIYFSNAAKVGARLLLPPDDDSYRMCLLAAILLVGLSVCGVVFYRRSRGLSALRGYASALSGMLVVSCILPMLTAVSTRTSESDRMLYLPSVFVCCLIALMLIFLGRGRWVLLSGTLVLGYMVFFLEKGNRNWAEASAITKKILFLADNRRKASHLFIVNLPDEKDGAFIFRLGFSEALVLSGIDTTGIVVVNHLSRDEELLLGDRIEAKALAAPPGVFFRPRGDCKAKVCRGWGGNKWTRA